MVKEELQIEQCCAVNRGLLRTAQAPDSNIHCGTSKSRASWFCSRLHRYTPRPPFTTFPWIQTERPHHGCRR